MSKVTITLRLSEDLDEWVRVQAAERGATLSQVVEEALRERVQYEAEGSE